MTRFPYVSVILPVYNGALWLKDAIQCVLDQTFKDFELIIINDGSKDNSWNIIRSFSDPRIKPHNQENIGLASTLNHGIQLASGIYIARQDQDDWMHPDRLNAQIKFLDHHPDYAAVGTWAEIRQDNNPTNRYHRHPTQNEALQFELLFDNPFVHSSMLLRREALVQIGGYSTDINRQPPEDYELWSRLARLYKVANLNSVLTAYREVENSMSRSSINPFQKKVIHLSTENLCKLLSPEYSKEQSASLSHIYHGLSMRNKNFSRKTAKAMLHLAARKINNGTTDWSSEFNHSYQRVSLHINRHFIRELCPTFLLDIIRKSRSH